jgi:SpoU rRNA methylase family enzyme
LSSRRAKTSSGKLTVTGISRLTVPLDDVQQAILVPRVTGNGISQGWVPEVAHLTLERNHEVVVGPGLQEEHLFVPQVTYELLAIVFLILNLSAEWG